MRDAKITDTGCYLDNHRGHYLTRDVIQLAQEFGFIIGQFEQFAVDMYQDHDGDETFPFEAMVELADEARDWLNSGQDKCQTCAVGSGDIRPGKVQIPNSDKHGHHLYFSWVICKECSGSGRGPRVKGQNFPPVIPEGYAWDWNDGDFGLYSIEDLSD